MINLHFDQEHSVLLHAEGSEAAKWLRRIRWFSPWLVMIWVFISRTAVPSHLGLAVWGRTGVVRLGEMAMLYRADWQVVNIIWLQSSRQKAWLHGFSVPNECDMNNLDEKASAQTQPNPEQS